MADDNADRQEAEEDGFYQSDSSSDSDEPKRKIEALEKEKAELLHENKEMKGKFEDMIAEIDELKKDKETLNDKLGKMRIEIEVEEEGKNAMESIAEHAADLELEVSQLQHDLISAMSESEEANMEMSELKKSLGEKEEKIFNLEREVEALKKAKMETEKVTRELELKIGVMEVRESEAKSEMTRIEQGMREKLDRKEVELLEYKRKVEDLEFVIVKNGEELTKYVKDKSAMQKVLKISGEKARVMELKMLHMQKEVGEVENAISMLKEKTIESVNGILDWDKKSMKARWSVFAIGSTGATVAVAAIAYALFSHRGPDR